MRLAFVALGKPEPQGSARAFLPKGWDRPVITSDNAALKAWRRIVAQAAALAIAELRRVEGSLDWPSGGFPVGGPVRLDVAFRLPRPVSFRKRDRPHVGRPDLDKLVRGVCDALSGVVWVDDGQVALLVARKAYAARGAEALAEIQVLQA